jgi:hypothetical protein
MSVDDLEALYAGLDQDELRSVAGCCSLSIEDVRQEARLLCWCIVSAQCSYDPLLGSPRQYVMGRLWGMTLRYPVSVRLNGQVADAESQETETPWVRERLLASPHVQEPVDPLLALITREEAAESESLSQSRKRQRLDRLNVRDRTFAELLLSAPIDRVAELYGITVRAARYRQEELLKQLDGEGGTLKEVH